MGYHFHGVFLAGGDALGVQLSSDWPGACVKRVTEPFHGWAIALPQEDADDDDAPSESPRTQVVRWSNGLPAQSIVYINADCFGGTCLYEGFTCRDGDVLRTEKLARRGDGVLCRLLADLGVELPADESFAPLTRGFFDT